MSTFDKSLLVAEAYTWLGTPYHHQQRLKGVGVDCAQLIAGIAEGAGLMENVITPMDYSAEWNYHNAEEKMLGYIEALGCTRTEHPEPGDIVAFKIGLAHGHLGILVSPNEFIHAYLEASEKGSESGKVSKMYLNGAWARRASLYYSYPNT
jgi:NlpC/P60 family putative phage cell wall peptidase